MLDFSKHKKYFFPVVHCISPDNKNYISHAIDNVRIAKDCGVSGCFLIGHEMRWDSLVQVFNKVRESFPDFWLGVNFLDIFDDLFLHRAFTLLENPNAIWTDTRLDDKNLFKDFDIFGGLEFKYQPKTLSRKDEVKAARRSTTCALTSGQATGSAPDIQKIKDLSTLLAGHPLGIASGVSTQNINEFLPYTQVYIVASSIVEAKPEGEYFVPEKLHELKHAITP